MRWSAARYPNQQEGSSDEGTRDWHRSWQDGIPLDRHGRTRQYRAQEAFLPIPAIAVSCEHTRLPDRHGSKLRLPSHRPQTSDLGARDPADPGSVREAVCEVAKERLPDAEAIAEAVRRPTMRFVPVKTEDQLDVQALHRVRERLMDQRTSLVNQLRAFFLERGLLVRTGRAYLWRVLPEVMAQAEETVSPRMFRLMQAIAQQWRVLEQQMDELDKEILRLDSCLVLLQNPDDRLFGKRPISSSTSNLDLVIQLPRSTIAPASAQTAWAPGYPGLPCRHGSLGAAEGGR